MTPGKFGCERYMEKKNITSERGTVYYWIGGNQSKDSACIVFTHGMTADHTMFDKQVEYFSKDYTIITWDIPLHGESRPYDNFTYQNVAQDLNRILTAEEIDRVILVGQSMGGYVCQEFAIQYPKKVTAFVAVDTTPFGECYYSKWERYILTKAGSIASLFPYTMLVKSIAKGATRTEYAYNNLYDSVSKLSKKEIVVIMDVAYNDFLQKTETAEFDFPVLLILGDRDNTGFVKKYNLMWSSRTGYPLEIISNAGHNSNVDNYDEFNDRVSLFLSKL